MSLGPTTSPTLLERIASGDDVGFSEFERRYSSMITSLGHLYRLDDRECAELVQEILLIFFRKGDRFRFDPKRGKFRTYLGKVIHDSASDIRRRRPVGSSGLPPETEDPAPTPDETADRVLLQMMCDDAMEQLLAHLRERVSPDTYRIFEHYVLKQHSPSELLDGESIGRNRIYKVKQRCLELLRRESREMRRNDPELRFYFD